jgi:surface antigen
MAFVRLAAVGSIVALSLAGCTSSGLQVPGLSGATTAGVVGGLIGTSVGRDLDDADKRVARNAEYQALEFGRAGAPITWKSPSGKTGEVIPQTTYSLNDTTCRDYTQAVFRDGRPEVARGTACRQPDGSWRSVA